MATSLELKQKREQVYIAMRDIRATMGADGKFTDATQENRWQASNTEFEQLTAQIKEAEQWEERERQMADAEYRIKDAADKKSGNPESLKYDDVFWRWMRRPQNGAMSPEELRMLESRGSSTQITSTDSLGGYLVPQSFSGELENQMKWYGGMLDACRIYDDVIGGTLTWPTGDDTASTGNVNTAANQAAQRTVADLTFGHVTFGHWIVDSNIIKVSRALVQDERVGLLQSVLRDDLSARLGRKVNTMLTTGTGTNESYGLTTAVTNSGGTSAAATAITKAELITLIHNVDRAYRVGPNVGFMMHDGIMGYLRKLDIGNTDTVQIFYPGIAAGEPDRLYQYPIFINNDLTGPTNGLPVASTKHIYFGDFSKYVIRRISGVMIERNDSLYWDSLSVGFMGWLRLDGNLINANAIKSFIQHS